jgi:purine-binding chemotaxis protein CheW
MSDIDERVHALRREFDGAFARPPPVEPPRAEEVLTLRVGGAPFAVRLAELAALRAHRAPTPLPGGPPGLLGVDAEGTTLLAVYDLAALLGRPEGELRWQIVPRADAEVALAFAALDGLGTLAADAHAEVLDLAAVVAAVHRSAR